MSSPTRSRSPRPRLAADDAARLQVRTEVLVQEHSAYIAQHPELVQLLQDMMTSALLHKTVDSFEFVKKFMCDVEGKMRVSQEEAAVKIQSIGRMKRDKARAQGIKQTRAHVSQPQPRAAKATKVPLVVAGAAGTGKSTVLARARAKYPHLLTVVVPHTSRQPQPEEDDGRDFFFVDAAQMEQMQQAGAFAVSWSSDGHLFGIQRSLLDDALRMNRVPMLELSTSSLVDLKASLHPARVLSACITPPPLEELEDRLLRSGSHSPEQVQRALQDAASDISLLETQSIFDVVIPCSTLNDCFLEVEKLALVAAGSKTVENFTADDEKRIVLMQTIARSKRDKRRVESIRQQRRVSLETLCCS
jgi:guanylate kinase